jgi:hypothetical protein
MRVFATGNAVDRTSMDEFFSWADAEHRKGTMSLEDAAILLHIDAAAAEAMIASDQLCANRDPDTGAWLVQTACVRAQLADGIDTAGGTGSETVNCDPEVADHQLHLSPIVETRVDQRMFLVAGETGPEVAVTQKAAGKPLPLDRAAVTSKNVEALMDSLDFANVRLEGAMYRIGYLEAQVAGFEEQLSVLPEFRARAAKAILTDRENDILKEQLDKVSAQAKGYEMMIDTLDADIASLETSLSASNGVIDKLQSLWWFRVGCWIFGFKIT